MGQCGGLLVERGRWQLVGWLFVGARALPAVGRGLCGCACVCARVCAVLRAPWCLPREQVHALSGGSASKRSQAQPGVLFDPAATHQRAQLEGRTGGMATPEGRIRVCLASLLPQANAYACCHKRMHRPAATSKRMPASACSSKRERPQCPLAAMCRPGRDSSSSNAPGVCLDPPQAWLRSLACMHVSRPPKHTRSKTRSVCVHVCVCISVWVWSIRPLCSPLCPHPGVCRTSATAVTHICLRSPSYACVDRSCGFSPSCAPHTRGWMHACLCTHPCSRPHLHCTCTRARTQPRPRPHCAPVYPCRPT